MRAIEKPRLRKEEKGSSNHEYFVRGSSLVDPCVVEIPGPKIYFKKDYPRNFKGG